MAAEHRVSAQKSRQKNGGFKQFEDACEGRDVRSRRPDFRRAKDRGRDADWKVKRDGQLVEHVVKEVLTVCASPDTTGGLSDQERSFTAAIIRNRTVWAPESPKGSGHDTIIIHRIDTLAHVTINGTLIAASRRRWGEPYRDRRRAN